MDLQFKYAAIGIFRDDANGITELRVIIVDGVRISCGL